MSLKGQLKSIYYTALVAKRLHGVHPRSCNICGYRGRFAGYGHPPRYDAQCPKCNGLERHRLLFTWFKANEDVLKDVDVLHFAPEAIVARYLVQTSRSYKSADIRPGRADLVLNIEKLDLPTSSIGLIVCSHILEHVDDRAALLELHRVLKPLGVVVLMFPIVEGWDATYEDPSVTSADARALHFGQSDHVRFFGRDVRQRIVDAGFQLEEWTATEPDVLRHGLQRGEKIFIARKPHSV